MYSYRLYIYDYMYMIIYIDDYIYIVIDLKVLVRSFNCESRACYVGNEFARITFFSRKFRGSWIL